MTRVFLSYAHRDEARVRVLERALRARGHEVFWDEEIPTGENWREVLRERVLGAQCVVVAWSPSSVRSDYVLLEAGLAFERGLLLPVLLEEAALPERFADVQTTDLRHWIGNVYDPAWEELAGRVQERSGVVPRPVEAGSPRFELESKDAPSPSPARDPTGGRSRGQEIVEQFIRSGLSLTPGQQDTFADLTTIRAHGDADFAGQVRDLERHGYEVVSNARGEATLERRKRFNWPIAGLLTLLFVFPGLLYLLIYPFLPDRQRVHVVQVD